MPYEKITFINQGPPGISADRLNHIQTQYDEAAADLAAHVAAPDPHPQYATDSDLATHLADKATHGAGSGTYLAVTSRTDQKPSWNDIPDKPSTFPPNSHSHVGSDIISPASGTPGARCIIISTSNPSGGSDGDVWIRYS